MICYSFLWPMREHLTSSSYMTGPCGQHPISSEQHVHIFWKKIKQQMHNQERGGCVSRPSANPWCKFTTHQKEKILILKISLAGQLSLGDKQKQFGDRTVFVDFCLCSKLCFISVKHEVCSRVLIFLCCIQIKVYLIFHMIWRTT